MASTENMRQQDLHYSAGVLVLAGLASFVVETGFAAFASSSIWRCKTLTVWIGGRGTLAACVRRSHSPIWITIRLPNDYMAGPGK